MAIDQSKIQLNETYAAGFNYGVTGVANTKNCNFRHFATPESKSEWERGVVDGKKRAIELAKREVAHG